MESSGGIGIDDCSAGRPTLLEKVREKIDWLGILEVSRRFLPRIRKINGSGVRRMGAGVEARGASATRFTNP
jgi:hypothetical protein